jgi:hypothetical protein
MSIIVGAEVTCLKILQYCEHLKTQAKNSNPRDRLVERLQYKNIESLRNLEKHS